MLAGTLLAGLAAAVRAKSKWPVHPLSQPAHAYVHLPFCRRRCFYCDFPVVVVGARAQAQIKAVNDYLDPLLREIRAAGRLERRAVAGGLTTVYIGGGTPSLAPPEAIAAILAELRASFGIAPGAEVTLELDPGTFDAASLGGYLAVGVSRTSIGIQSFDPARLTAAGRAHTVDDGASALALMRAAREDGALRSWSLDLIGGLPDESEEGWAATLRGAINAAPDHISVYDLTIEPTTAYGRWAESGKLAGRLPTDDASADMYRAAAQTLGAAGYEHYEVSSYARAGHRSRHNGAYWRNAPFVAFGVGASSYTNAVRLSRPRGLGEYREWVGKFESDGKAGQLADGELVDARDWLLETVMLALRRSDGLDLDELGATFGDASARACADALADAETRGLVARVAGTGALGIVRLTSPEGFLLSNGVISDVFVALGKCALPDESLSGYAFLPGDEAGAAVVPRAENVGFNIS
jgi:oxygen-independent coproporphyrinogen-3 oxidase